MRPAQTPSARINQLTEPQTMTANELILSDAFPQLSLYTPMSRVEWERNQAIAEKLLSEVFGEQDTPQAD